MVLYFLHMGHLKVSHTRHKHLRIVSLLFSTIGATLTFSLLQSLFIIPSPMCPYIHFKIQVSATLILSSFLVHVRNRRIYLATKCYPLRSFKQSPSYGLQHKVNMSRSIKNPFKAQSKSFSKNYHKKGLNNVY